MGKPARVFLWVVALLAVILLGIAGWLWFALGHVPDFYTQAMAADTTRQVEANREMLKQSAALAGDTRKEGRWQARFTTEQINAWFAVDLVENHPRLLPPEIRNVRVALQPRMISLACKYHAAVSTVLSTQAEVYLSEPNVIAVRLKSARAGAVPVPMREVLNGISFAAAELNLNLEWRQIDGDPVALVKLPLSAEGRRDRLRLDALEVRDGEVYIAGSTEKRQD